MGLLVRNFGKKYQGGWVQLVAAAISAAAAAKAASDARRARLGAQQQAVDTSGQDYERQKEFAQNAIQWRVADAKKAGLHPLYALSGGGASYSPQPFQTFQYDPRPTLAYGQALNQGLYAAADYWGWGKDARVVPGELSVAPTYQYDDDFWSAPGERSWPDSSVALSRRSLGIPDPSPYGITSSTPRPAMAYWDVPQLGRIIAPDASNFSESLEGLESPLGQGIVLYLNRDKGEKVLDFLAQKMGAGSVAQLARSRYWSDPVGAGLDDVKTWLDKHRR